MQVTREDLNSCTVKLTVTCEPEEVRQGFDKAFKQISKNVKVPGFRPGHVPKPMLEKMIDKNTLYDQAADNIVRVVFKKAVDEQKLEPDPNTRPSVSLDKLNDETAECVFTAKVPLPPKIELGEYKGLPIEKQTVEVSEEEVTYQIDEFRKRKSTREPITDRGVQEGDMAVVNIKPDGDQTDGRNFMTLVGQMFPQLDEVVIGMKVEEMKHAEISFPENFTDKDWAGKTVKAQVTLNSASAVTLPDLDEKFAQSLKTESVDDLKAKLSERIKTAKEQMVREIMIEQAMEKLLERSKVEVSDNTWEEIAARRLMETQQEQQQAGKTMEDYAKENGMTLDELVKAWQEKAQLYIKRAFLIRDLFTKENMVLTNDELNVELFSMAQEYEVPPQEMLDMLQKNNAIEELRFRSVSRKVSDFLLQNADIKEVAAAGA